MTKIRATTSSRVTDKRPPAAPRGNGGLKSTQAKATPGPPKQQFNYTRTPSGVGVYKKGPVIVGEAKTEDSKVSRPKNRAPKTANRPR